MDDFSNELGVCSICSTETTFTDHVVLQKSLDHIREGTLNKIPEGGLQVELMKSAESANDAKTEENFFLITYCA